MTKVTTKKVTTKKTLLDHVKALAARPILRALVETPLLRTRLARSRSAPVEGQVVDAALAVMLALDDVTHDSDYRGATPVQARARMRQSIPLVEAPEPAGVSTRDEVLPGGIDSRLYSPVGLPAPSPGLVFLHGGGWVTGDLETHDRLCRRLAAHGKIRVVAIDYRLAPEHRYPAAVDDALAAFRHVAHEAPHFGIDPTRLGVGGDSAGGNLAAVVARRTRGEEVTPAVTALIYPSLDTSRSLASHRTFGERYLLTGLQIEWYLAHYLGDVEAGAKDPDVSPLAAADPGGLGPHLVTVAHFDPLRDEGLAYARKLAAARVPVKVVSLPTMIHGFTLVGGVSPAALAATEALVVDIGEALRGVLEPPA